MKFGAIVAGALIAPIGTAIFGPVWAAQEFEVRVVSSRPDAVSGGDALVEVRAPSSSGWVAMLDGHDVSASFHPLDDPHASLALLKGLRDGKNTLEIRLGVRIRAKLEMVNHPRAGPVFSGPHQQPFICQTVANGLGPPVDKDCNAETIVQYYYKSTEAADVSYDAGAPSAVGFAPGFKAYDISAPPPPDLAQTVTSDGRIVNYIVRREIGTLNRGVYDIQFLHEPGRPLPTPWAPSSPGWNRRLIYLMDGGCGAGYRQGVFRGSVGAANEPFVAQGYATATSTLNSFGNNCNDRISAETLSMVKEHFVKTYGAPVHTIGWGESGGAMQLYLTVQNYPGLLDGIIPYIAFPDIATYAQSVTDCSLIDRALQNSSLLWTEEQKSAISGFASWRTCSQAHAGFALADATTFCDLAVPKDLIYERAANPKGARCDIYDNEINVFGRNPKTGFAERPLDNVGVQYGLSAFNSGQIDADHFIDLNERVGGYDEDGRFVSTRMTADLDSLRAAYQRGLVMTGGGGVSQVPIIEWRPYSDDLADNHDRARSFVTRARLVAAYANADNQVILVYPRYSFIDAWKFVITRRWEAVFAERTRNLVRQMDRWLNNIEADDALGTRAAKVARNRPTELADGCWATDGEHIIEPATYGASGRCNQLYPPHADPRMAAGGPLTDDILKCVLKPIDPADYVRPLTSEQLLRLRSIFPTGVCDYSRPGVGQQPTTRTWQRY